MPRGDTYTLVIDDLDDGSEVTRVTTFGHEDDTTDFDESGFPTISFQPIS